MFLINNYLAYSDIVMHEKLGYIARFLCYIPQFVSSYISRIYCLKKWIKPLVEVS